MRASPRPRAARPLRRALPAGILAGLGIALSAPGAALALFSAAPSAPSAGVTAATISSPTGFAATAASSTMATLSWTAPSALTGYTLSQSTGTLSGCSATPSASTTSCTATGLSPNTSYTWTLRAAYNNWNSPAAQASATTLPSITAVLLAKATDTSSSSQSSTVTGVSTTSGAALLVLVYRQGSNGNLGISSISGTAITGPSQVTSQTFNSNGKYAVMAWQATGTGTSGGTVTVNFSSANNVTTTIDVVQLSGASTSSPVAQYAVTTSAGSRTVTGGSLTGVSSNDGEVFFVGLVASTTTSTPAGYTALDAPASATHGSWFSSSASSSGAATSLGTSTAWAAIELAIQP